MNKQVVIIGAGVIGLSTAYYCALRGMQVTVVDRGTAKDEGTSFGNAGMIVPSHFIPLAAPGMIAMGLKWMWNPASPFYIKPRLDADLIGWGLKFWKASTAAHVSRSGPLLRDLCLASRQCFEELSELPGMDFGLEKKGLLMLCQTTHGLDEEAKVAERARALGIPADVLDAAQTAELDPGAKMNIAGSVHFPLDCHLTPERFMRVLREDAERRGVKFIWQREVTDLRISGNRIDAVTLDDGSQLEPDELILCGGAWSPELTRKLGLSIPMQAGKGYSLTLQNPRQSPRICSLLTEARVAVTPMGDTLRVGGTMEIAGLNPRVNPVRVRGIIDSFCRYFPEFAPADFEGIAPWHGMRPCSPDGLPYIGRSARHANLTIGTGHAMMGLTLGPVTGRILADTLLGKKPEHDLALLSPNRY